MDADEHNDSGTVGRSNDESGPLRFRGYNSLQATPALWRVGPEPTMGGL
jgi:hypothetical protein